MSPSLSTRPDEGMPWTISSFSEMQIEAGNPYSPLNDARAPSRATVRSAISSICLVVCPAASFSSISARTVATTRPARCIVASSRSDFRTIGTLAAHPVDRPQQLLRDDRRRLVAVDRPQLALAAVVVDQRRGPLAVDAQPGPDRLRRVVLALVQLAAAPVAPPRHARRRGRLVVGRVAV